MIDEQRLADQLPLARGLATPLNRGWLPSVESAIQELLGTRSAVGLDTGRIFLFVFSEYGDFGCGAITAALALDEHGNTWSQFAWKTGYEPPEPIEDAPMSFVFGDW